MRENADQNNSEYGHFLRSVVVAVFSLVHYDTLLQKATDITKKWDSYFISKCNKSLLQSASCFFFKKKCDSFITRQDVTFITKYNEFVIKI